MNETAKRPTLPNLPTFCAGPFSANIAGQIVGVDAFGEPCHVADIRGWGYLTGRGGLALGLDHDAAVQAQMQTVQFILDAMNEKMARDEIEGEP